VKALKYTVYYHGHSSLVGAKYRKYGPAQPGGTLSQWYSLTDVTFGSVSIAGEAVATASFTLHDNQPGDSTGDDGVIVDPGGPAISATNIMPVPGLNRSALMLLALLLLSVGYLYRVSAN
jgi:hypothetical protein